MRARLFPHLLDDHAAPARERTPCISKQQRAGEADSMLDMQQQGIMLPLHLKQSFSSGDERLKRVGGNGAPNLSQTERAIASELRINAPHSLADIAGRRSRPGMAHLPMMQPAWEWQTSSRVKLP